jgi:transposase
MIRKSKEKVYFRLELVTYAKEHGIKPAARSFCTTPKTVRKWIKRYKEEGIKGLEDRSKAPHNIPHKTSKELEEKIKELKMRLPSWGALRLKRDFQLPCSEKVILRVYKENGLIKRKRRKYQTKNDLRKIKQRWKLFSHNVIDTKELKDIPEYWVQMKRFNLPQVQYTYREVVSGLQFIGFASEVSLTYATIFVDKIKQHLISCGVDLSNSIWQTDNGSEFVGSWNAKKKSSFSKVIEDKEPHCIHSTIPPGAHRWQADIETVHRLIEDEFYEVEEFHSIDEFINKANSYQYFFNVIRPNSSKGGKSPLEIIQERDNKINPKIALFPVLFLDRVQEDMVNQSSTKEAKEAKGGYDLPSYP